jgi:hypothetical protein
MLLIVPFMCVLMSVTDIGDDGMLLVGNCATTSIMVRHYSWRLSVPYRKALPNTGRAFQFVDHRDGVILN